MKKLYTTPSVEVEEMELLANTLVNISAGDPEDTTHKHVGESKESLFGGFDENEDNAEY